MSSAIREARIAFGNDLTGMETGGVGESVIRSKLEEDPTLIEEPMT